MYLASFLYVLTVDYLATTVTVIIVSVVVSANHCQAGVARHYPCL
jgi:hypothetical protein